MSTPMRTNHWNIRVNSYNVDTASHDGHLASTGETGDHQFRGQPRNLSARIRDEGEDRSDVRSHSPEWMCAIDPSGGWP